MFCFLHHCHYFKVALLPIIFPSLCWMQDPLWEDEKEDIHNAVEYSILESNSAEMTLLEDENEDIHHAVEYSILESNSAELDFVGEQPKQLS